MAVSVRVKFHPEAIAEAKRRLAAAGGRIRAHEASIGIHEEKGSLPKDDYYGHGAVETLAQVMMEHEFGTDALPERSFLRQWFDTNVERLAWGMRTAMEKELLGDKTAVRAWVIRTHKEWMEWIAAGGNFVGLMPSTIAAKAAAGLASPDVPLIATKQFIDAWRAKLDGAAL